MIMSDVVIYSREHQGYWRPHGNGYTSSIDLAGTWPEEEARRIIEGCGPEKQLELKPASCIRVRKINADKSVVYWGDSENGRLIVRGAGLSSDFHIEIPECLLSADDAEQLIGALRRAIEVAKEMKQS